jgi:hypothetical protein
MLFQKIRNLYYFMYYCNFRIMDSIASKSMKNSSIHGWTWPMFVFCFNLAAVDSLFELDIYGKNSHYLWGALICICLFNFFVFTYKNRHDAIIEDCSKLPYRLRRFGVLFFAFYSILSPIVMFIVLIAKWKINL